MNRKEARESINSRPELVLSLLTKSKGPNQYVCPCCGSGTGANHTGALTFYPDTNRFFCYACGDKPETFGGKGQDVLGALCILNNCTEKEIFEREYINISREDNKAPMKTTQTQQLPQDEPIKEKKNFLEYIKSCRDNIDNPEAQDYLRLRGLSNDTAARLLLGYDTKKKELIIPVSKHFYIARRLYPGDLPRYDNPKETAVELYNLQALYNEDARPVFIVEGVFDALSIIECGGLAIALNGTPHKSKLIKALEKKRTNATLLLSLDNDEDGKKATAELEAELKRINIPYVLTSVNGKYKDANDNMLANKKAFKDTIQAIERASNKPYNTQDYIRHTMAAEISSLEEQSHRKTGFSNIDEQLHSLYPGLYVIGALSSLGKTTFVYQLCDQMAARGEHILFYSLEQSRLELVSKSLARYTALEDPTQAINSLQIRTGYKPPIVERAIEKYINDVDDRVQIIEGNFYITGDEIAKEAKLYIEKNKVAPIVVVDYLQVLQPSIDPETGKKPTDARTTVEANIKALKRMSRSLNIPVIVISSVNRSNYELPIDFEAFKESGLIEFTADFVAGLQLTAIHDEIFNSQNKVAAKRDIIRKAKDAIPRELEFVVLKNRFGRRFESYFDYYPQFDLFKPVPAKYYTGNGKQEII